MNRDRDHQTGQTRFQTLFDVLHTQSRADGTFFNDLNRRISAPARSSRES